MVTHPDHPPGRGEAATVLTHGRLLGRNAIWNLLSQVAPLAVAVMTIPVLIRGLGTDRFGVLTLAWMVLGYFSLFDFGLGRALTKLVAERLGLGLEGDIPDLVWTALGLMMALGLAGAALVILIAPWLVRGVLQIPGPLQRESLVAFYLLAASLPFLIITAGLRGVMEAYQRVGLSNLVRAGVGLFTLVGPLLVLPFARGLGPVVAVLVVVRLASWAIHLRLCLGAVPGLRRGVAVRSDLVRPLLSFCGWLTLTNIVVPIMVQMDRFFIGALVSTAAVAYYTTPFELVIKGWFISGAVLGAVFPAFATSFACDRGRTELIFVKSLNYIFILMFPITLALVALAPEGLALWLGPDFARQSTAVLRWLAIGVFLNALAASPLVAHAGDRAARPGREVAPGRIAPLPAGRLAPDRSARDRGSGAGLDRADGPGPIPVLRRGSAGLARHLGTDPSPGVAPRAVHAQLRRGRPAALHRRPVPFPPDRPRHLLDHDVAPGPRA